MLPEFRERLRLFISARKQAYSLTFSPPYGQEVLRDLARFCRANESTFHPDDRVSAQMDGRREVFLRIQKYLGWTDEQLWQFYERKLPNE